MKRAVVKLEVHVTVFAPDDVIDRLTGDYDNELDLWRDLAVGIVKDVEEYNGLDPEHAQENYPVGWVQLSGDVADEEMYEGPEDYETRNQLQVMIASSSASSCDACDSQEDGGHYCKLHSRTLTNMNILRCKDWSPRQSTTQEN